MSFFIGLDVSLYLKPLIHINEDGAFDWMCARVDEMSRMAHPMEGLINRLNASWGKQGEPGDVDEIHHVCKMISEHLHQMLLHEEEIYFSVLPDHKPSN